MASNKKENGILRDKFDLLIRDVDDKDSIYIPNCLPERITSLYMHLRKLSSLL